MSELTEENVTFHGRLTEQTCGYQKCRFILPTTSHEGLPWPPSVAYGLATIASNIGGIPTAITELHDGILIPPGNVEALTNELSELIKNGEYRMKTGSAARKTVEQRYSMQKMVDDTLEVLSRCAEK